MSWAPAAAMLSEARLFRGAPVRPGEGACLEAADEPVLVDHGRR